MTAQWPNLIKTELFFQDTWIADSRKASETSNFSQFSQFSFQKFCILDKNFDHYLIFNPIRSDSPLKIQNFGKFCRTVNQVYFQLISQQTKLLMEQQQKINSLRQIIFGGQNQNLSQSEPDASSILRLQMAAQLQVNTNDVIIFFIILIFRLNQLSVWLQIWVKLLPLLILVVPFPEVHQVQVQLWPLVPLAPIYFVPVSNDQPQRHSRHQSHRQIISSRPLVRANVLPRPR